ncbi:phosphoglycerate kinase [Aquiluna sp. Uisw_065]|uniref:phosphoglycerate kinase n=1 Tax=Aquiluna sp. Uisw_065 TaxID=3230967 RepID=UPI0039ED41ED
MLRTLDDAGDLRSKAVIVRCDLNVPLSNSQITDDGRIRASLETINRLVGAGAKVILASHLGRPKEREVELSLAPVATRLQELLGKDVKFSPECTGDLAQALTSSLKDGEVALLENLRFDAAETSSDPQQRAAFARELATMADIMVSDGFGVVHRKQASVYELAGLLPSCAGLLVEAELKVLDRLTTTPSRPYTVVLGGSKVSDKLAVIGHLLPKVDRLAIGGGMVFTVLKAMGHNVGKSLLEEDQVETTRDLLKQAADLGVQIILPTDIEIASSFSAEATHKTVQADAIEESELGAEVLGLDIGPESAKIFAEAVASSKTVFWNGPMGVFEFPNFAHGTKVVAEALTQVNGLSVVGGGDSAAAVRALGFDEASFGHISTGGGASLEYLEGKTLPGLEVLND